VVGGPHHHDLIPQPYPRRTCHAGDDAIGDCSRQWLLVSALMSSPIAERPGRLVRRSADDASRNCSLLGTVSTSDEIIVSPKKYMRRRRSRVEPTLRLQFCFSALGVVSKHEGGGRHMSLVQMPATGTAETTLNIQGKTPLHLRLSNVMAVPSLFLLCDNQSLKIRNVLPLAIRTVLASVALH
jgi:hypothetical protein